MEAGNSCAIVVFGKGNFVWNWFCELQKNVSASMRRPWNHVHVTRATSITSTTTSSSTNCTRYCRETSSSSTRFVTHSFPKDNKKNSSITRFRSIYNSAIFKWSWNSWCISMNDQISNALLELRIDGEIIHLGEKKTIRVKFDYFSLLKTYYFSRGL